MVINRQKAGGLVAVISGIYGIVYVVFTMMESGTEEIVTRVGWGGAFFSFVLIVLGAVAFGEKSRWVGALIVVTALGGIAWVGGWLIVGASRGTMSGGMPVGICMVLSLVGGILAIV